MSRYLSIVSRHRPFPFGVDEVSRVMYSVNIEAEAEAEVAAWEQELAARLVSEGAATAIGTDIFWGPKAVIPSGAGPYISILDTGGIDPGRIHGQAAAKTEKLSAQIVIRADNTTAARTRALAVWRALDGVFNTTLAA